MRVTTSLAQNRSNTYFLRTLRVVLWALPAFMAFVGLLYTLVEHAPHQNNQFMLWETAAALVVLSIIGPALAWFSLRWALRMAKAHVAAEERLARRVEELATLNHLALAASRTLEFETRIVTILENTIEALDATAGMVFLQQNGQTGLRLVAHRGISVEMAKKEARLAPGHCLCGQAVKTREILFAEDVSQDRRCTSNLCICDGFRSVACTALEANGQLVGLLQLASPRRGYFTEDQRDFLAAAAGHISVSIENARLYDTVRTLNVTLEQKVNERTRELESARWALAEKARQLQRLLGESYRIQEDTQARIAHDIHDGVTQIIIGALYETQAAREALADDPDRAAENLARAQGLLTDAEMEIRRVIYDLHPPVLDVMGLVVALKRFAATFSTTFGITCRIDVTGTPQRLEREAEIAIYRVLQAALHNVASHSQAKQVVVCFEFADAALLVSVEDDGIGFDAAAVMSAPGEHLGLIGMQERAKSLGADLKVVSVPAQGTRIELRLSALRYADSSSRLVEPGR